MPRTFWIIHSHPSLLLFVCSRSCRTLSETWDISNGIQGCELKPPSFFQMNVSKFSNESYKRAMFHPHYAAVIEFWVRNVDSLVSTMCSFISCFFSFLCYWTLLKIRLFFFLSRKARNKCDNTFLMSPSLSYLYKKYKITAAILCDW